MWHVLWRCVSLDNSLWLDEGRFQLPSSSLPCQAHITSPGLLASWHNQSSLALLYSYFFTWKRRKMHLHLQFTLQLAHQEPNWVSVDYGLLICHLHAVVGQVLWLSPQPSNNKSTSLTAAIVSLSSMNAKVASSIGRNTNKNVASLQIQSVLLCQINLLGKKGVVECTLLS